MDYKEATKNFDNVTEENFSLMLIDHFKQQSDVSKEDRNLIAKIARKIASLFFKYKEKAVELLKNSYQIEPFLLNVEEKVKDIPKVGEKLKYIPECILLIRSYAIGEYTDITKAELVIIIAMLLYFVTPLDIIPDFIPKIGYKDDLAVNMIVIKYCEDDIKKYMEWVRNKNGI